MSLGRRRWMDTAWQGRNAFLSSGTMMMTLSGALKSPPPVGPSTSTAHAIRDLHNMGWLVCTACRYEIYAISRPATLVAHASYPLTRYYQRRFVRESMAAVGAAAGD